MQQNPPTENTQNRMMVGHFLPQDAQYSVSELVINWNLDTKLTKKTVWDDGPILGTGDPSRLQQDIAIILPYGSTIS